MNIIKLHVRLCRRSRYLPWTKLFSVIPMSRFHSLMLSPPHVGTKPGESRCWSQAGLCVAGRTWDTICQALAVSAELFFTADWLLDCVFLTLSRSYLLLWSDLSPQGLALFHLCRSQAALPPFCSLFWGIFLWLQSALKQAMEVMCSLTLLSVLPPFIGEQICCSQVGCAFTYTDVSIHNSSRTILALVTNPTAVNIFFYVYS